MNSIKIEKAAIEALKRIIRLHDRMDELLQSNDKEPSWDGDIIIYSNEDLKVENILYKIPTQVKGKNDENLLNRTRITYPVKYKHLRNYFNNGGVCYFVIVISDDGERTTIFYNTLTPIKLKSLLKKRENKEPDRTKNITLNRLENNKNDLFKILLQFGHDRNEQGNGELVRRAITFRDIVKVDSVCATAYADSIEEAINKIEIGEVCLFGHREDSNIWFPFEYEYQRNIEMNRFKIINKPVCVGKVCYYDFYIVEFRKTGALIYLSEDLFVDLMTRKVWYHAKGELKDVEKDLVFLERICKGECCYIGDELLFKSIKNLKDKDMAYINTLKFIIEALEFYEIPCKKKMSDFTLNDLKALFELTDIYRGNIEVEGESMWYMWWWNGKVVPLLVGKDSEGEICSSNIMASDDMTCLGNNYKIPGFVWVLRDVWEYLYDVEENRLVEKVENSDICTVTAKYFLFSAMEILSAYDITKNETYYNLARLVIEKLLAVDSNKLEIRISYLQLIKRKRDLTEGELQELENIEVGTNDKMMACAVNILLENKRKAKKELDEMSNEDKETFMSYPIYNLL